MLDPELSARLDEISAKADKAFQSAEKVRKYILWTGIIAAALFILPIIGLMFAIPMFMNSYITPVQTMTGSTPPSVDLYQILGL